MTHVIAPSMTAIGTGKGVAALLNGNAKRVTSATVRGLREALPDALVLVSQDLDEARAHAERIAREEPFLVLSGGGDGAIMRLLNLLREHGPLPTLGILKLGTGNGWARVCGAPDFSELVRRIARLPSALPTQSFDLVETEGLLCHFAGVGWDASILNDYAVNLRRRGSQLLGSRLATWLHKSALGYLYSTFRRTIPQEWKKLRAHGQPRVTLENLGDSVFELDHRGRPLPVLEGQGGTAAGKLYEGPVSVGAAGTTPEWGYGFKAFPFALARPGHLNLRIYNRPVLEAARSAVNLWRGRFPQPGMFDFFVKRARMTFSRPMPFQIGGDAVGTREQIELAIAPEKARVVDWRAALAGRPETLT